MGALDSSGRLGVACAHYLGAGYPRGRAASARRACVAAWMGVLCDNPAVDWVHVADWLDAHRRGLAVGHD